jgi:hypothetical protein
MLCCVQCWMRYDAWQIKEIVDLTLQPMETMKEEFLMNFDTDGEEVEIEAILTYFPARLLPQAPIPAIME